MDASTTSPGEPTQKPTHIHWTQASKLEKQTVEVQSRRHTRPVSSPDIVSLFRVDSISKSSSLRRIHSENSYRTAYGEVGPFMFDEHALAKKDTRFASDRRSSTSDILQRPVEASEYSSSSSESEEDDMTKQIEEMEERERESKESFARAAKLWMEEKQTLENSKSQLERELEMKRKQIELLQKKMRETAPATTDCDCCIL